MDNPATSLVVQKELDVQAYWKRENIFAKTLEATRDQPLFRFYEGPPFASGPPHMGHLITKSIKDSVIRYASMNGHYVPRVAGWDTHGLPLEAKAQEKLGVSSRQEILDLGLVKFNETCRQIVMTARSDWEKTTERFGQWIDFEHDYKTMDLSYMNRVWQIFGQLYEKGLVYRGVKVMPYSTGCSTVWSNFEANLNMKEVTDPALTVRMRLRHTNDLPPNTFFLVFTTTPWTLPCNLALAVARNLEYVLVTDIEELSGNYFLLEKSCLMRYFNNEVSGTDSNCNTVYIITHKVVATLKGSDLIGLSYEPLYPYYVLTGKEYPGSFTVIEGNFVTNKTGSGIVHLAPGFGADDFTACCNAGIVSPRSVPCPIDDVGHFLPEISEYAGEYVKDCDKKIIMSLKKRSCVQQITYEKHKYPYCWRSETPLLYRASPCWFLAVASPAQAEDVTLRPETSHQGLAVASPAQAEDVTLRPETSHQGLAVSSSVHVEESIKDRLIKHNREIKWMPSFVGTGRMGNWLESVVDWCVSRNRFWGTPIPLWVDDEYNEVVCIRDLEELKAIGVRNNQPVESLTDLHRHSVDDILIPSRKRPGTFLHRIEEIFDCWFESGAMPYASDLRTEGPIDPVPADFISESIDQVRGWFYTLNVLSTMLYDRPAFTNCVVSGLVLGADGTKMSKSKGNYSPPELVMDKYGGDALRLYLLNSPVVAAGELVFKDDEVEKIVKNVHMYLYNSVRFLHQMITFYEQTAGTGLDAQPLTAGTGVEFLISPLSNPTSLVDLWFLQCTSSYVNDIHAKMKDYDLQPIYGLIYTYVQNLSNWYLKLNRSHMKAWTESDCPSVHQSLQTLYRCLFTFISVTTPFAPMLCESIFLDIRRYCPEHAKVESLSLLRMPTITDQDNTDLLVPFAKLMEVIPMVRNIRGSLSISARMPILSLIIISPHVDIVEALKKVSSIIHDELNIVSLTFDTNESQYVQYSLSLNAKSAGKKFGAKIKAINTTLPSLPDTLVSEFLITGSLTLHGCQLTKEDLIVNRRLSPEYSVFTFATQGDISILIDNTVTHETELIFESKQLNRKIQDLRKEAQLTLLDDVHPYVAVSGNSMISEVLDNQERYLLPYLNRKVLLVVPCEELIMERTYPIDDSTSLRIALYRPN